MKHLGDITKISGYDAPVVDVVIGGSLCQDLSVAGKRAGLAGARSGLYMEQIRVIREMREADALRGRTDELIRPRYMVWENVPGAFSSNGGKDFSAVLEEAIRVAEPKAPAVPVPDKGWPTSGCLFDVDGRWSVAWRVFDAQFWGVPQRRRRIALVADFGGLSAPEILFVRKGVSGHSEPGEQKRKEAARDAGNGADSAVYCLQGNGIDRAETAGCNGKGWREDVCYTLNTIDRPAVLPFDTTQITSHQNGSNPHYGDPCHTIAAGAHPPAAVICFSNKKNSNDRSAVSQPVLLESNQNHAKVLTDGICTTLPASMGMGGGYIPMVMGFAYKAGAKAGSCAAQEEMGATLLAGRNDAAVYDARGNGDGLIAPTMTGDHQNRVTDYTAICIGNGQTNQGCGEKAGALNCMHDQQAVYCPDVAHALKAKANCDFREGSETYPVTNHNVRRLTTLECERLQGYPDGWTDIGDWVDSKGKKHKDADSPRYKALGNSIALPNWAWVLKRISAVYERDATMASLFDGIGGFPLIWERINGKGSCLWASEIEEFPMAVTKLRFGG